MRRGGGCYEQHLGRRIAVPAPAEHAAAGLNDADKLAGPERDLKGAALENCLGVVRAQHDHHEIEREMRSNGHRQIGAAVEGRSFHGGARVGRIGRPTAERVHDGLVVAAQKALHDPWPLLLGWVALARDSRRLGYPSPAVRVTEDQDALGRGACA